MKVKTSELTGPALNWAVATADKRTILRTLCGDIVVRGHRADGSEIFDDSYSFTPSEAWSQGGPIIERKWLDITPWPNESDEGLRWQCHQYDAPNPYQMVGPTPLIAAMRCIVASHLGDEVDVPDELA